MTKPPITLDLKCQFFALYLGQKCIFVGKGRPARNLGPENILTPDNLYFTCFLPHRPLKLKALSSITNEDAEKVAEIGGWLPGSYGLSDKGRELIGDFSRDADIIVPGLFWLQIFDFLRSKGYALPFLTFDVPELIQLGWVQLEFDPQ